MKTIIAMFLLIFSIASCGPKCDCTKCAEICKSEVSSQMSNDSTVVDTLVEEIKTEK